MKNCNYKNVHMNNMTTVNYGSEGCKKIMQFIAPFINAVENCLDELNLDIAIEIMPSSDFANLEGYNIGTYDTVRVTIPSKEWGIVNDMPAEVDTIRSYMYTDFARITDNKIIILADLVMRLTDKSNISICGNYFKYRFKKLLYVHKKNTIAEHGRILNAAVDMAMKQRDNAVRVLFEAEHAQAENFKQFQLISKQISNM